MNNFITIPSEEEVAAHYTQDDQKGYRGESSPSPRRIMRCMEQQSAYLKAGRFVETLKQRFNS